VQDIRRRKRRCEKAAKSLKHALGARGRFGGRLCVFVVEIRVFVAADVQIGRFFKKLDVHLECDLLARFLFVNVEPFLVYADKKHDDSRGAQEYGDFLKGAVYLACPEQIFEEKNSKKYPLGKQKRVRDKFVDYPPRDDSPDHFQQIEVVGKRGGLFFVFLFHAACSFRDFYFVFSITWQNFFILTSVAFFKNKKRRQ
jgi:hypothetical protein